MPTTTPSRLGQANLTGDDDALFYKVFANEVLATFNRETVTLDKHRVRNLTNAKSAGFNVIGSATAGYHTVGTNILDPANGLLNQIAHGEKIINLDDILVAPTFIADLDELKNHYEVRGEYSTQLGEALARQFDQNVLQTTVLTARASANLSNDARSFGGSVLTQSDVPSLGSTGESIVEAIRKASVLLKEKDVPYRDGRTYCYLRPEEYDMVSAVLNIQNQDFGGPGNYNEGIVPMIKGIKVIETNNLPSTNIAAVTGQNNTYSGDFTNTVGVIAHESAMGTVRAKDISFESERKATYLGDYMHACNAVGHGILRPECAVELSSAA